MQFKLIKYLATIRHCIFFLIFRYTIERQLYFLHIKKTGGTSIRKFLERQFHYNDILPPMNLPVLKNIPTEEIRRLRFVSGHFNSTYRKQYEINPILLTILRDPVERVVSEFYYWKHPFNIDDDPRKPKDIDTLTLNSFISDPAFTNTQAKALADNQNSNPNQLLNQAFNTLLQTAWFGITEFSEQSIDMLTYLFGWRPTNFDQKINSNPSKPRIEEVDSRTIDKIKEVNYIDMSLYAKAIEQFTDRYFAFLTLIFGIHTAKKLIKLPYDVVRVRVKPHLWKQYHRKTSKQARKSSLIYTFDQALSGEYWMRSEGKQSSTEHMWRWTAGENATIDFPLKRDIPLILRFHVKAIVSKNLKIFVDDLEVQHVQEVAIEDGKSGIYSCLLPTSSTWQKELTTITFHSENLQAIKRPGVQITDSRKVGIAIEKIEFFPSIELLQATASSQVQH
ncbi:sulfotransferase family 2 domain-containing protein [bacterium]|nr:sulfotransferase family 2 domain-containing protein [bacterium]